MIPGRSTTSPPPESGPTLIARMRGWIQAAHPFPVVAVLGLTALVGIAPAGSNRDWPRLGVVLSAMLLSQLAIGWTNDYVDRGSDALHQPAKPVPSGLVPAGRLPWAIVLVLLASLAAGGVLGLVPLLCLAIGTAAGLAYDLVFKDTRLSWLPFVVAFAVLPPFVWSALDVFRDEFLWLYPIALPLTIAVHVANTLPDLKSDTAAGRGSIAVALGRRRALWLLTVLMATPVALLGLTLAWVQYDEASLATILAFYAPPLTYAGIAYRRGDRENEVWAFRCVAIAAVLFSGGWLAAV